jgi:hypothetical protein
MVEYSDKNSLCISTVACLKLLHQVYTYRFHISYNLAYAVID